jgi:hypothetical protein
MKNLNLLSIILGLVLIISSCGDSEDNEVIPSLPGAPSDVIGKEFAKLFPGITDVQWKDGGEGYKVASFKTKGLTKGNTLKSTVKSLKSDSEEYATEGWFSSEGSCDMIESEVTMDNIPQKIVDAWNKTEEKAEGYKVYDVDYIVYRSNPIIKIETEFVDDFYNDGCDLFYNLDGELLFINVRSWKKKIRIKKIDLYLQICTLI